MKKLAIFVGIVTITLGLFCGCDDKSENGKTKEVTTTTAISWDEMIPDYNKIFKNGTITTKYATGTTKDEVAGAYFVIEDVTQEEYEAYIKETAKMYPNIISQSFDVLDEQPYGMFYANDDVVKHSVLVILDVDPFSEKLTCSVTCETCRAETEGEDEDEK